MKSDQRLKAAILFLAAGMGLAMHARAEAEAAPPFTLAIKPPSRLWLLGDSTLHPYSSTTTVISLDAQFKGTPAGSLLESLGRSDVLKFHISIPVETLSQAHTIRGLCSGILGLSRSRTS